MTKKRCHNFQVAASFVNSMDKHHNRMLLPWHSTTTLEREEIGHSRLCLHVACFKDLHLMFCNVLDSSSTYYHWRKAVILYFLVSVALMLVARSIKSNPWRANANKEGTKLILVLNTSHGQNISIIKRKPNAKHWEGAFLVWIKFDDYFTLKTGVLYTPFDLRWLTGCCQEITS